MELAPASRVVVTGLGPISPVGMDQEAFFQGLLEGQSRLGQVTRFDPSEYTCQIAAQVADDFNAKVISMQIPFFFLSFLKASRSYDNGFGLKLM